MGNGDAAVDLLRGGNDHKDDDAEQEVEVL